MGLLGVFVPIAINFRAFEQLKEIKNKADDAKTNAEAAKSNSEIASANSNNALTNSNNALTNSNNALSNSSQALTNSTAALMNSDIAKIKADEFSKKAIEFEKKIVDFESVKNEVTQLSSDIENVKYRVANASTAADSALSSADQAVEKSRHLEKLLLTLNSIVKLKDLDINTLRVYKDSEKIDVIKNILSHIHVGLTACDDHFDHTLIKDCLKQLAYRIHFISLFDFLGKQRMGLMTNFVVEANNILANPLTADSFQQFLNKLDNLLQNL